MGKARKAYKILVQTSVREWPLEGHGNVRVILSLILGREIGCDSGRWIELTCLCLEMVLIPNRVKHLDFLTREFIT
jgi:hypothetical protein